VGIEETEDMLALLKNPLDEELKSRVAQTRLSRVEWILRPINCVADRVTGGKMRGEVINGRILRNDS